MMTVTSEGFRDWLLRQVDRADTTGKLARDVQSEEKRCARPLTMLNNRVDFLAYARGIPREAGITLADAVGVWDEWAAFTLKMGKPEGICLTSTGNDRL